MRITKPLIGTAAGAAVLGATLALGVSMASASTSSTGAARTSQTSSTATTSTPASPAATSTSPKASTAPGSMKGHKCTHMSGSARSSASAVPSAN